MSSRGFTRERKRRNVAIAAAVVSLAVVALLVFAATRDDGSAVGRDAPQIATTFVLATLDRVRATGYVPHAPNTECD